MEKHEKNKAEWRKVISRNEKGSIRRALAVRRKDNANARDSMYTKEGIKENKEEAEVSGRVDT